MGNAQARNVSAGGGHNPNLNDPPGAGVPEGGVPNMVPLTYGCVSRWRPARDASVPRERDAAVPRERANAGR